MRARSVSAGNAAAQILLAIEDITERKRAEEETLRSAEAHGIRSCETPGGSRPKRRRTPHFCCAIPIATMDTMSAISIANIMASKQEELMWRTERDPITNFGKWLIEQKISDQATLHLLEMELEAEMKKAVELAVVAPYPNVDEVGDDVYA